MDIESVISKNIGGYLKPKFPIYRVKYFKAELIINDVDLSHTLNGDYYECICELKKDETTSAWNEYFDEDRSVIYERLITEMNGKKSWKVYADEFEHIVVIELEQIA